MKYEDFLLKNVTHFLIRPGTTDIDVIREIWADKSYYHPEFEIKDNYTVIDIGAHIGCFSVYAAKQAKKLLAFEPEPENFQLLKRNILSNNVKNAELFNCAVSGRSGEAKLFLHGDETRMHSMYSKSGDFITVKSNSLKNIFDENNISFCHLVKIDAEGAEYEILHNTPRSYFGKIGMFILEYHDSIRQGELLKLTRLLSKAGFEIKGICPAFYKQGTLFAKRSRKSKIAVLFNNNFRLFNLWFKIFLQFTSRETDSILGKVGMLLKSNAPKLYYYIKRLKEGIRR